MADSAVAVTAGAGTNIDTRTEGTNGHHRQVVVVGDPASNAGVAPVDATNGLSVTLTTALPAGTAAIGKLAANSGVDIGDVDVTSCALPTGAATSAKQDTVIGHLDGVETLLGTIDGDTGNLADAVATIGSTKLLKVAVFDDADTQITSFGGGAGGSGTEYTEDAAAAGNPVGGAVILVRADALAGVTSADGDNIAARGTDKGELYVKHVDAIPVTDNGGNISIDDGGNTITVDGTVAVTNAGLTELAAAIDTEVQCDIVAALPAGTNNIGDVDILTIAAGDNNIGNVDVVTMPNVTLAAGTNTNEVVGDVAHDAAVGGNPVLTGAEARGTLGTAVATGDAVRIAANRYGMLYNTAIVPSRASSNGTPIAATTTSVIAAPSAGSHLRVVRIHLSNGGSTSTWISIRDGAAGTQFYRTFLPLNGVMSLNLSQSGPLDLTTATRLDIVMSAAGSVEYTIDYLTVAD